MSSTNTSFPPTTSFFLRHEFLIRRLHSLSGLIPIGAYMCVHLLVNASLIAGPATFQKYVFDIHSLPMLPLIEWTFIFGPIIFHAVVGVWIAQTGRSNTRQYRYASNYRYALQRITGYIAIVYIFTHVFHLHGWFHNDWWLKTVAEPLGMAQFRPYNAASSLALAMSSWGGIFWPAFYFVGMLACIFHLANGIWTAGITWGFWLTPRAQQRANVFCAVFGVFITLVGVAALWASKTTNAVEAKTIEDDMYDVRVKGHMTTPNDHKRTDGRKQVKPEPISMK